jgi:hypothetical protein
VEWKKEENMKEKGEKTEEKWILKLPRQNKRKKRAKIKPKRVHEE